MIKAISVGLALIFFLYGTAASSTTTWIMQWDEASGGNGHWYQVVWDADDSEGWTWNDAETLAKGSSHDGLQGHLVTITSQKENDFISSSNFLKDVFNGLYSETIWLGGYQDSDAQTQTAGWHWVTGEAWDYTGWYSNQPNNLAHNYLAMMAGGISVNSGWYDVDYNSRFWNDQGVAYIVEYEQSSPVPLPGGWVFLFTGLVCIYKLRKKQDAL